jgi:acyl dehydratase
MARRYFEDFTLDEVWTSPEFPVTEAEMLDFARRYDPQPMHTDPEAAARGPHGTVIASGWHIAALTLKAFVEAGGYGETPVLGLGTDELRWTQVVRPGDRLTVRREVVGLRRSGSNPMNGLVTTRITATNQSGRIVLSMVSTGMVSARGPG